MSGIWFGPLLASTDIAGDTVVSLTGVYATGTLGYIVVGIPVSSVYATGTLGTLTVNTSSNVTLTGVYATGTLGSVGSVEFSITGVSCTGTIGSVTCSIGTSATASVTGVSITSYVSGVSSWGNIPNSVRANWVEIN